MKGLRARGGFEVTQLTWRDGKIQSLKVKSTIGGNLRLRSNTPLSNVSGVALTKATGDNSNELMQDYNMPEPIVADASKIPATILPETYLYDIPTMAGQEIELIGQDSDTAIRTVNATDAQLSTLYPRWSPCHRCLSWHRHHQRQKGGLEIKEKKGRRK